MTHNDNALVLHLSDIHYGEVVDFPENKYDVDVANKRIYNVFDKAQLLTNILHPSIDIQECHIFITGDTVHNELMRGVAKMNTQINFVEQIIGVSDALACGVEYLKNSCPNLASITIYGVRGNHGRVGPPGENDPNASLDLQVYDRLDLLLQNEPSCEVIKTDYPYIWTTIMGWSFVAEHGDSARSQMGIPFYGLNRLRDARYKNLSGKMDYLLVGHFHQQYIQSDGTLEVLMCPSLVGMNDYSVSFGAGNLVRQMMYIVNPEHGITMYVPLNAGE